MRLDNNLLRGDDEDFAENLDWVVCMSVALRLGKGKDHDTIRREVPPMANKAAADVHPDDPIFHESVAEYVRQAIERELAKAG